MSEQQIKIIDEAPPEGHLQGMGLLRAEDPRDRNFQLPRIGYSRTFRNWLNPGRILDQGATSECVIYSGDAFLTAHRTVNESFDPDNPNVSAQRTAIYKQVQAIDEWPGDNYDGTSVRAMFKWLQARGLIGEYRWAFDSQTAIAHVLETSPIVMGTNWTWGMMDTDAHGYVSYSGGVAGGHAWLVVGANTERKNPDGSTGAIRGQNSWGPNWGDKGRFWLSFTDFARLIADQGDAGVATEIKAVRLGSST